MPIKMFGSQYADMRAGEKPTLTNPTVRDGLKMGRVVVPLVPPKGYVMWVDASDESSITKSGTSVSAIADKSGNNRGFTGTATYVPAQQNGLSVLDVSATQALINANCNFSATAHTMFSVTRCTATVIGGRILQGGSNNWLFGFWEDQHARFYFGAWLSEETNKDTIWHCHSAWWSGGATQVYEKGVSKGSAASGTYGPNNLGINAGTFSAEKTTNQIAEILIYTGKLTDAERNVVENYLLGKWGIK